MIDLNGSVVHHWDVTTEQANCFPGVHLQRDGLMLRTFCPTEFHTGGKQGGGVARVGWDGKVTWELKDRSMHHGPVVLPNGNILTPYLDPRTADEVKAVCGITGPPPRSSLSLPPFLFSFLFFFFFFFSSFLLVPLPPRK